MKSFIPSIIALAGLCFLADDGEKQDKSSIDLVKIAQAHPDWDLADIAKRSPVCDCEGKCNCAAPCLCNVVDEKPRPIADTKPAITPAEAQQVAVVTEPKFTQPAPVVAKPTPKPVVKSVKPMPAAKSQAPVYYAPVQSGSCGPGGCGRVGLFGRRR